MHLFLLFAIGTVWGSFIHVIAYRVPVQKYFHTGRSNCEQCKHDLAVSDLVPILSYILRGGKCRYCSKSISPLHPLVEILTGLGFVTCYLQSNNNAEFLFFILFLSILLMLGIADIYYMRLPNYFLLILLSLTLIFKVSESTNWLEQLIIVGLVFIGLIILQQLTKKGMGMGDIKLISIFAILFSFDQLLGLIILSCLTALLFIIVNIFRKNLNQLKKIPFGPFLCTWAFIFLVYH